LTIAALKLGARHAVGVDIDPDAVRTARANARRNDVAGEFLEGCAPLTFTADVVIANILANPLKVLAPMLASRCRRGGQIALSGILSDQASEVESCYSPWIAFAPPAERRAGCASRGKAVSMITRCPACATAFRVTEPQLRARAGQVRCGRCGALFDALTALSPGPTSRPAREDAQGPISASMAVLLDTDRDVSFDFGPQSRPRPSRLWWLASVFLVLALVVQASYQYRGEIAVLLPEQSRSSSASAPSSGATCRYRAARSC